MKSFNVIAFLCHCYFDFGRQTPPRNLLIKDALKLDGVASLVADPSQYNSTTDQICPLRLGGDVKANEEDEYSGNHSKGWFT